MILITFILLLIHLIHDFTSFSTQAHSQQHDMLQFVNFKWLLKVIYSLAKFSGFIFISINLNSSKARLENHFWDVLVFSLSFGFSIAALSFDGNLPITLLTHSKILGIGVPIITKLTISMAFILKLSTAVQKRNFFKIISDLQWVEEKVSVLFRVAKRIQIFSFLSQLQHMKTVSMAKVQILKTVSAFILYNLTFAFVRIALKYLFLKLDFDRWMSVKNEIFLSVSVFQYLQFCTSLMMLVSSGYCQLLALSNHLKTCVEECMESPARDVIKQTMIIYDRMCDVFESISAFYLISNLIFLLGLTYFTVFFYYSLFVYYNNPTEELGFFTAICYCWCLYYSPFMIWITIISSKIETEGTKISNLVQQLANMNNELENFRSSNLMYLLTAHRKLRIHFGIYDINWKASFASTGSIFSFCVILIQFYDVSKD